MKKIPSYIVVLFAAFSLISCAMMSFIEEKSNADYGEYPEDYKVLVENNMNYILADPHDPVNYSNWRGPSQAVSGNWLDTKEFGYGVCVDIDAKNRIDGYRVDETFYFFMKDGRLIKTFGESSGSLDMCKFLK